MALAKSVTAVAIAKGAAASGSTLTLIKGALKIMAWTKAKTVSSAWACCSPVGTTTITVKEIQKRKMESLEVPKSMEWQVPKADFGVLQITRPRS